MRVNTSKIFLLCNHPGFNHRDRVENTGRCPNGSETEAFNLSYPPEVCHLSAAPVSTMPNNNCLISYCAGQAQCSQQTFPQ